MWRTENELKYQETKKSYLIEEERLLGLLNQFSDFQEFLAQHWKAIGESVENDNASLLLETLQLKIEPKNIEQSLKTSIGR